MKSKLGISFELKGLMLTYQGKSFNPESSNQNLFSEDNLRGIDEELKLNDHAVVTQQKAQSKSNYEEKNERSCFRSCCSIF
jgi:hypothetical protein